MNALVGAVDADHLAIAISESVPVPLRLIGQLVAAGIHAAGGDFVQQRLPDVRACTIDERDLGLAFTAELVAELRREFEPAGAAADDDDAVELRFQWSKRLRVQRDSYGPHARKVTIQRN